MMAPLNVVCLISGGKDSLFSILHCLRNGHHVVALANLHPPLAGAEEDLDSYMYQTVGHKVIPLYEAALGLPLHRQEIAGSAVNQNKNYGQNAAEPGELQDETESLMPLLRNVQEHHPEVNAVSTGAILSDYQRTRVESVAIRLGLTPLAYLWQWPNMPPHTQSTLLEDMHAAGQDSRIIKVASGGLDSSFLWCNVADQRAISRLDKAVKRFGSGDDGAVLGEGGEYETLAIAGPGPLWKGRINVAEDQIRVVPGEAGSASVSIEGAKVHEQELSDFTGVRVPQLLEPQFEALLQEIRTGNEDVAGLVGNYEYASPSNALPDHVCYQYLTGPEGKSVTEQTAAIMDRSALSALLQLQNPPLEFGGIAYVSIILRDMAHFAAVNAVYTAAFTEPNPPARITLAEPSVLPEGKDVMIAFTCVRCPLTARLGLHVQSQSYWAPANIGPYSQATSVPAHCGQEDESERVVYIAGQIPLVPASMEFAAPEAKDGDVEAFTTQAVLAAQHSFRVGRAMQVGKWACGMAFITAVSEDDAGKKANTAHRVWKSLHQSATASNAGDEGDEEADEEDFDIWNVTHGTHRTFDRKRSPHRSHTDVTHVVTEETPRLEVVQVEALPRGASVEWAIYGLTGHEASAPRIPHFEHLLDVFKDRLVH